MPLPPLLDATCLNTKHCRVTGHGHFLVTGFRTLAFLEKQQTQRKCWYFQRNESQSGQKLSKEVFASPCVLYKVESLWIFWVDD